MANKTGNIAPVRLELLITIVDKNKASSYADFIQAYDVNLQIVVPAKGTAKDEVLEYLGLADSDRVAIFSVVRADRLEELSEAIEDRFRSLKNGNGICVAVPFSSVIGRLAFGFLSNDERIAEEEAAR